MSKDEEQETVEEEEEEEIDYKEIEKKVKPLVDELDKHEETAKQKRLEIAMILYPIYMKPNCNNRLLIETTHKSTTWFYNLIHEFDLETKFPKISNAQKLRYSFNPVERTTVVDVIETEMEENNPVPENGDWLDNANPNYIEKEDSGYKAYQNVHDRIRAPKRVTFYDITKYPAYKEKLISEVKETIKWLEDQLDWIEKMEAKNERERTNTGKS